MSPSISNSNDPVLTVRVPPGDGSDVAGRGPGVRSPGDGLAGSSPGPPLTAVTIFHCFTTRQTERTLV